jgi:Domain of unknown function (DUF397)
MIPPGVEMSCAGLSHAHWQTSTWSGSNGGQCVEVARNLPGVVAVRDSKDRGDPALVFSRAAWTAFLAAIKTG